MQKYSDSDSDDSNIPELDEVILKQIENFKPITKLKKTINASELGNEGTIIETAEQKHDEEEMVNNLQYDAMDLDEDQENIEEEAKFYNSLKPTMIDITGDGGVMKTIIRAGNGPVVSKNSMCRIHYSAYLKDDIEPYDTTRLKNRHVIITIGKEGSGIAGLLIGLSTMRKNEEAQFLIRPEYAYGSLGCPPRIPRNAHILMNVELISFVDQEAGEQSNVIAEEEVVDKKTWEYIIKRVEYMHKQGNDYFQHKEYRKALAKYGKAIRLAENAVLYSQEEEEKMNNFCVKMFLNVALCSLKLGQMKYVVSLCKRVLSIDPSNIKATFRLGQAYRLTAKYEKSKKFLLAAQSIAPINEDICNELVLLSHNISEYNTAQTNMCKAMLNNIDSKRSVVDAEAKILETSLSEIEATLSKHFEEKLRIFSEDEKSKTVVFPNIYLEREVDIIKQAALKFNVSIKVEKRSITIERI